MKLYNFGILSRHYIIKWSCDVYCALNIKMHERFLNVIFYLETSYGLKYMYIVNEVPNIC